jgi:putative transposase
MRVVREKPHRLPDSAYCGRVSVSFTACVEHRRALFTDPKVVEHFVSILDEETRALGCEVPIYCFMPDHMHVIIKGRDWSSAPKAAMGCFKWVSGNWLKQHRPAFEWQKDFHDRILRVAEADTKVIYIACNPLRAGLVASPLDYAFTGSLATDWKELLANSIW